MNYQRRATELTISVDSEPTLLNETIDFVLTICVANSLIREENEGVKDVIWANDNVHFDRTAEANERHREGSSTSGE